MRTLNVLSSRRNQITRTIDVIDLMNVNDISQTTDQQGELQYKGGLEVLGQFDEGKCIKVNMRTGKSYIICSTAVNKVLSLAYYIYKMNKSKKSKKTAYESDAV